MSLLANLNPDTVYSVDNKELGGNSKITMSKLTTVSKTISSLEVSTAVHEHSVAKSLVESAFTHDYRFVLRLLPTIESMAEEDTDLGRKKHLADIKSTLNVIENQYDERYSPIILHAIKQAHMPEFDVRKYIAGSLLEDCDRLVREGFVGSELKCLFPSLVKHSENSTLHALHPIFEKQCEEYDANKNTNTLRAAVGILIAAQSMIL